MDRGNNEELDSWFAHCYVPPKTNPSLVQTLSLSEADALRTLSSLSQSTVDKKICNQHLLTNCTDEIQHKVKCNWTGKIRVWKRKRRGKCSEWGNNTRFSCLSCEPQGNRRHYWCGPDYTPASKRMCHRKHIEKCGHEQK